MCRCTVFPSEQGGERPAAVCQSRLNRGATGTEDGTQHLVGLLRHHKPLAQLLSPGWPAFSFFFQFVQPILVSCIDVVPLQKTAALAATHRRHGEARSERLQLPRGAEPVFDPSGGEASVLGVPSTLWFRLRYFERLAVAGFLFC